MTEIVKRINKLLDHWRLRSGMQGINVEALLKESKRRGRKMLVAALVVAGVLLLLLLTGKLQSLVERLSPLENVLLALVIVVPIWVGEKRMTRYVSEPTRRISCSKCGLELAQVLNLTYFARQKREIGFCPSCGMDFRGMGIN